MKIKIVGAVLIAGLLTWSLPSWADQTNYSIGKVAAADLKIGLGARPVAMGETFVGCADDINATSWNPAGLAQIKGYQAGFMHNLYLLDTSLEYLAYAQNLFAGAGIGANVTYLNYGKLDKVDDLAQVIGDFTPSAFTLSVGYGQWVLPSLSMGGTVKFLNLRIDTESYSAVAADLGAIFQPGVKGLQLGLAVQNLGTQLAESPLPMNAKLGAAYGLPIHFSEKDAWNFLADVNVPFGDTKYTSVNVGTEYVYNQMLALRAGYKVKDTGDLGGVTGLTLGAGIRFAMLQLDYAMLSFGDLGLTHQISLAVSFE
jgi:hypothetical protein